MEQPITTLQVGGRIGINVSRDEQTGEIVLRGIEAPICSGYSSHKTFIATGEADDDHSPTQREWRYPPNTLFREIRSRCECQLVIEEGVLNPEFVRITVGSHPARPGAICFTGQQHLEDVHFIISGDHQVFGGETRIDKLDLRIDGKSYVQGFVVTENLSMFNIGYEGHTFIGVLPTTVVRRGDSYQKGMDDLKTFIV
jgi:hypothetical protein